MEILKYVKNRYIVHNSHVMLKTVEHRPFLPVEHPGPLAVRGFFRNFAQ